MPLPNKNETKDDYLQRCMGSSEMQKYDQDRRYALCNAYWKEEQSMQRLRNIFSNKPKTIFDDSTNKQN